MPDLADDDLRALPKVELHVHLEGSIAAATAIRLATRHGEDPERALVLQDGRYPHRYRDFAHFVETFVSTSRQVRTPEDLHTVAATFARQQADANVRYTEATFTALSLVDNGWEPTAMWDAIAEGLATEPRTRVRLIVDAVRDAGVRHAERTLELVRDAAGRDLIVGIGLAGIEGAVPERDFAVLRTAADELGLGLAVHAGETGTADNVRAAIDELGADRIGHGNAMVHDAALLARVARERVPVEVCPTSNVKLGLVPDHESHPMADMWRAGVNLTINSDDPPFFSTTLTEELARARDLLELGRAGLAELQRRAADAAFTDGTTRNRLRDEIDTWDATGPGAG